MKILFIAPTLPLNNGSGGSIRSFQLYQELKSFADVDVLTANGSGISFPLLRAFKAEHHYVGHIEIPWKQSFFEIRNKLHPSLKKILKEQHYDYIFVRYYNMAYWLGVIGLSNLILDCDDCILELSEQQRLARKDIPSKEKLAAVLLNYFRRKNYIKNISLAKKVIFSKKSKELEWKNNFVLLQNKISFVKNYESFEKTFKSNSGVKILFIGVLNYAPNYEGLDYFLSYIWPIVTSKRKNVILKIVGDGLPPSYKQRWQQLSGVEIHGYVENINQVYADVDFSIAPVYQGSGTHIKVMESLMRFKPMVISQLAHRGYEDTLLDGESLFVADDVADFAKKVILLVDDCKLRERMSLRGSEQVLRYHAIKPGTMNLKKILQEKNGSTLQVANTLTLRI